MRETLISIDEAQRLTELRGLGLLDTPREERFDRITRLAARLFGVPIALFSLVDDHRQWFKSRQGLGVTEAPKHLSFCAHVVATGEPLVVPDALDDPRFSAHPLVAREPRVRFYAGLPIQGPSGAVLGTLCLMDEYVRTFSADEMLAFADLAKMLEQQIADVQLAIHDELTGLSNRRGFATVGRKVLEMSVRSKVGAVLIYLDMDRLKPINDQLGHEFGDSALRETAGILINVFRSSDVIARVGGDEFVVLLSGAASAAEAIARLRRVLTDRNATSSLPYTISMSIGVAEFDPRHPYSLEDLVVIADAGMRAEKATKGPSR